MQALARAAVCDCDVPPGRRWPVDGTPQRGRIRSAVQTLRPIRCHANHPLGLGTLAESVRTGYIGRIGTDWRTALRNHAIITSHWLRGAGTADSSGRLPGGLQRVSRGVGTRQTVSLMPHTFTIGEVLHLLWGGQSCPQPPFRRLFLYASAPS